MLLVNFMRTKNLLHSSKFKIHVRILLSISQTPHVERQKHETKVKLSYVCFYLTAHVSYSKYDVFKNRTQRLRIKVYVFLSSGSFNLCSLYICYKNKK